MDIWTFYRTPGGRPTAYWLGAGLPLTTPYLMTTIILLGIRQCLLPQTQLLEYVLGELAEQRTGEEHPGGCVVMWGPERPWYKNKEWRHPAFKGMGEVEWGDISLRAEEVRKHGRGTLRIRVDPAAWGVWIILTAHRVQTIFLGKSPEYQPLVMGCK